MKKITTFSSFEKAFGFEHLKKEDVGLDNIRKYLKAAGNPEKKLPFIVHIAGTNGKGSTGAALESILTEHGITIGLHTSPHLVSYTERFRIQKKPIEKEKLIARLNSIYQILQKNNLNLSLFESLTAAAMHYFFDENVDVAIFETGLGGRLDATNVLPSSVQIITNISKDHTDYLGDTLREIAFEKASIIKKESTVITSNTGENLDIISSFVQKTNSLLIDPSLFTISKESLSLEETSFELELHDKNYSLHTNLLGEHQAQNTSLSFIAAKEVLKNAFSLIKAEEGLKKIIWPARLQVISKTPLIILDGAHNESGVDSLMNSLSYLNITPQKIYFTSKKTKDYESALKKLTSLNTEVILVNVAHFMLDTPDISKKYPKLKMISLDEMISEISHNKNEPMLITGSLYFIGEFLRQSNVHFPFQQLPFLYK